MSKTRTSKYALQIKLESGRCVTPMCWFTSEYGPATDVELVRWVKAFEASTRPGGANEHLGAETVVRALITRNVLGGEVVAMYYSK